MPRKKAVKNETPKKEIKVEKPKLEEVIKKVEEELAPRQEFRVLDRQLQYVRTYTVREHGKDAGVLAKRFAAKIRGWVN